MSEDVVMRTKADAHLYVLSSLGLAGCGHSNGILTHKPQREDYDSAE